MKRTITFLTLILILGLAFGKQIDQTVARNVAQNFLQHKTNSQKLKDVSDLQFVYRSASKASNPLASAESATYFYVFNAGSIGFVIISGDDNVIPVLGYSDQGVFDPANIPQNTAKWFEEYKNQIRYVIEHQIQATEEIEMEWQDLTDGTDAKGTSKRAGVNPLMQTTWNQSPYYNATCPGGSVTGCVATAMAQIMKFWNYPTTGTGFHSYNHQNYGTLSANFGSTTYQWSSMPNAVNSSNSAVATLMLQVGISVDMDYSPQVSGAYVISAKSPVTNCSEYALKTYFGYNSVSGVQRASYSDAQWLSLLKTELNAGRPILYAGFGSGGGHCFVADGFDNSDFVHFNWGWGGAYDGFFSINALNPSGTGTGGGTGGFNSGHQAVINIKPPSGGGGGGTDHKIALYNYVTPSASTIYYIQGFDVSTNFINNGTVSYSGDFSAAIFDDNYDFVDFVEIKTGYTLSAGYVFQNNMVFSNTGLVSMLPGTYYVGVFYRPTGGNWVQVANNGSYTNLVQMTVINPNLMELSKAITPTPTLFTQGKTASVNLNIENTGSSVFTGQYQANLYDLKGAFVETIGTITETNGLPSGYTYVSPYLTFTSSSISAPPGTYLIAILHQKTGGSWEITGSTDYQNPIKIDVQAPGLLPDAYEANNSGSAAYNLPVSFSGNTSSVNTSGSNCHLESDVDFYKIVLPAGYNYTITPRLHDSYNSANGNTYTTDALFSYSSDGSSWSDAYDNFMPGTIPVTNGGTIYFQIAPYFAGETGTYQFDISTTRTTGTGIQTVNENLIQLYPNPAKDHINIDLHAFNEVQKQVNLINIQGQNVWTFEAGSDNQIMVVPVANLPEGVYFIQIRTGDVLISKKVVIIK